MNDTNTVAQDGTDTATGSQNLGAERREPTDGVRNFEMIMDIPVTLSIELGRTRMSIQDLLQLNAGSVIELERAVDEPMDVLVNGTLVARGEVVVVDDKFGIRLTDVISPMERVQKLQ